VETFDYEVFLPFYLSFKYIHTVNANVINIY